MDFEEFKQRAAEEIRKLAGDSRVEIHEMLKNNSTRLTGLLIGKPGSKVCPVIYLDGYFEDICSGKGFHETVAEIWDVYQQNAEKESVDMSAFAEWEDAKGKIFARLVNYGENKEMLKSVPHVRFLDLAVVYYYLMERKEEGIASVQVNHIHAGMWGIGRRELEEAACVNHKRHCRMEVKRIDEMIGELLGASPEEARDDSMPMYVVTNQWMLGGAVAMLFSEELFHLAGFLRTDLYILPSSIHELIVVPAYMGRPEELAEMVKEVNRTQVRPEDRLSDNVYSFSCRNGLITIA